MTQSKQKWQYRFIDGKHVIDSELVVYRFDLPWTEDVIAMASFPLHEWEQSESGKWVNDHAVETPRWERYTDYATFTEQFAIIARLTEADQIFFRLKFA